MCNIIFMIIEKISPKEVSEQMIDDILFGIARDNECSHIVRELLEYSEWYSLLCKKSLYTDVQCRRLYMKSISVGYVR